MMKAVAYYRSRPSEPEASELALSRQREAVEKEIVDSNLDLVAEFVEREGENGSETYPAFLAAVNAANAFNGGEGYLDVMLFIAGRAAVGTGEPFNEPVVEGPHGFITLDLEVRFLPAPPEIELPAGAPGLLCLYADCQPRQAETLIYLCNAGPDPFTVVTVTITTIDMHKFFSSKTTEECWSGESSFTREQHWDAVPSKKGVLVASANHHFMESVSRYRLAYSDVDGRRCEAEANDWQLLNTYYRWDAHQIWVAFEPIPRD